MKTKTQPTNQETPTLNLFTNVKITHKEFGIILDDTFVNGEQFKLFLKAINGCFMNKNDLTMFNGVDFFIHIPFDVLNESIIVTTIKEYSPSDAIIARSRLEMKV